MSTFGLTADRELQATLCNFASQTIERKALDFLFHQGERPHGCYLIKSGKARLWMEASPGHRVLQRVVGEGCLVGLPASINGRVYSLTCEVIEDAEVAYLSSRDLALVMKGDTAAAMKLLDLLSSEIQAVRSEFANSSRS
jgi:CRP/FNR family transcriptional regulator